MGSVDPPFTVPEANEAVTPPIKLAVPVPMAALGEVVPPGTSAVAGPLKFHWVKIVCA